MADEFSKILSGNPHALAEYQRRQEQALTAAALKLNRPYTGKGIEYLDRALPYLAEYDERGWEKLPFDRHGDGVNVTVVSFMARDVLTRRFAWAVPDEQALQAIAALSPIVEVGAGSGYWCKELRKRGAKVAPYDRYPYPLFNAQISWSHSAVAKGGPERALRDHPERTLFLCWPSYALNWAAQAVRRHRGEHVAYIGEGLGGCTGDDELHILLELLYEEIETMRVPRWYGMHDDLTIYRRTAEWSEAMATELEIALHAHADRYGLDDED